MSLAYVWGVYIYHHIQLCVNDQSLYMCGRRRRAIGGGQRRGSAPIRLRRPGWSAYAWRWRSPACWSVSAASAAQRALLAANLERPTVKKKGSPSPWPAAHTNNDPLASSSRAREATATMPPAEASWSRSQWQHVRQPWASLNGRNHKREF